MIVEEFLIRFGAPHNHLGLAVHRQDGGLAFLFDVVKVQARIGAENVTAHARCFRRSSDLRCSAEDVLPRMSLTPPPDIG